MSIGCEISSCEQPQHEHIMLCSQTSYSILSLPFHFSSSPQIGNFYTRLKNGIGFRCCWAGSICTTDRQFRWKHFWLSQISQNSVHSSRTINTRWLNRLRSQQLLKRLLRQSKEGPFRIHLEVETLRRLRPIRILRLSPRRQEVFPFHLSRFHKRSARKLWLHLMQAWHRRFKILLRWTRWTNLESFRCLQLHCFLRLHRSRTHPRPRHPLRTILQPWLLRLEASTLPHSRLLQVELIVRYPAIPFCHHRLQWRGPLRHLHFHNSFRHPLSTCCCVMPMRFLPWFLYFPAPKRKCMNKPFGY